MNKNNGSGNVTIHADIPPRGMKDSWMILMQKSLDRIGETLFDLKGNTDIRPIMLTRFLINLIPDPESRDDIMKIWDENLEKAINQYKTDNDNDINNDEEGRLNILVAINIIGHVASYTDLHIGVWHKLEIGTA